MAGNTSGHSPDFVLTVDTTVAPVSDLQVTDDVAQHTGPLTSGGLTNDATPALSGTAEAGATVTIYDGSTVLGTAVADEDGHWRFTPDPLGEGEHRLSTTVTDVAGNTSGHSPDFVLTVDTTVAPVSDLQVTDDVAQHTGPLTSGGLTNDATPALSGTALMMRRRPYDGGSCWVTVTMRTDGIWRASPLPVADGTPGHLPTASHHGHRCDVARTHRPLTTVTNDATPAPERTPP
ncbi:Ig-like domain-containing protein [Klebsiella pneumoniae]|uniref:Ig-like domain-containing protein n=1 Tax=Klebsiella pneumoniae TaxID=573 RepID=UPI00221EA7C5|nr:Ig-like domain-containing protein [Klebsiella pneumoniae]UYT44891.1 Ig-like domain-containing protein [Klebsiella pneumoniae]